MVDSNGQAAGSFPSPAPDAARDEAFGIYVHWPFCAAKCPYCDFNSHVRAAIDQARMCAAYLTELRHFATRTPGCTVTSVFFGGGTPSLMPPETVAAVLDAIARHWSVSPTAEVTLEANPSSADAARFAGYRAAGVNRVSLGVQSLRDRELQRLGRLHDAAEARAAIALAHRHFDRVSFDLIYARSGQTVVQWRAELAEALALAAGHLSLYQLTIEDGTPFAALHAAGKLPIPAAEPAHEMYLATAELTAAAGLPVYETSNHARPGEESRHNLLYWRYGTYAGIGPGAHGRLAVDDHRLATVTERLPERWLEAVEHRGHGIVEEARLGHAEMADEMLLMGLRLTEGVDLARMRWLTGRAPAGEAVARLRADGFLAPAGVGGADRLVVSVEGRFVLDEIVLQLSRSVVPVDAVAR